jgi:hypothetical protein
VIPHLANKKSDFDLIKEQLSINVDVVSKGMARLGMQARQLSSLEVLDLFYSFYNPQQAKLQPLTERALNMIYSSMVHKDRKEDENVEVDR